MKTSSVLAVVTAALFTLANPAVIGCDPGLLRQAAALESTASRIMCEFREEVSYRPICPDERAFMDECASLKGMTSKLRCGLESGRDPCQLDMTFTAVQRHFSCMQERANYLRTCGCVREMMSSFGRTLCAMKPAFAYASAPRYDYRDRDVPRYDYREAPRYEHRESPRYDDRYAPAPRYEERRPVSQQEAVLRGLLGLLQGR